MPPQQYTAQLEDFLVLNDKYVHLFFELLQPNIMQFLPGQYISILVADNGLRRSYSLCSSSDITHGFELLVDVGPDGPGTKYLKSLKIGDKISFVGPLGRFVIAPPVSTPPLQLDLELTQQSTTVQTVSEGVRPIYFIATGSGIAPYRSMIKHVLDTDQTKRPIHLYWGMRFVEQLFWLDVFGEWEDAHPQFHFHAILSKPVPEWTLSRGRVTTVLAALDLPTEADYYLCGNTGMIDEMMHLLQSKNISQNHIYHEKFH